MRETWPRPYTKGRDHMHPKVTIASMKLVICLLFLTATDSGASRIRLEPPEEIVTKASAIILGTPVKIETPAGAEKHKGIVYSAVTIKVHESYKGTLKPGSQVKVLYWSHGSQGRWSQPDVYTVGKKSLYALTSLTAEQVKKQWEALRENPGELKRYPEGQQPLFPKDFLKIVWRNFYKAHYNFDGDPQFKRCLEILKEPKKYLNDPKNCGMALYILAYNDQASEDDVRTAFTVADPANFMRLLTVKESPKFKAAIPIMMEVVTRGDRYDKLMSYVRNYKDPKAWMNDERKAKRMLTQMIQNPITLMSLRKILSVAREKDYRKEILLKLATQGATCDGSLTHGILRCAEGRAEITEALKQSVKKNASLLRLEILSRIDPVSAYQYRETVCKKKVGNYLDWFASNYHTAWIKRHVLENPSNGYDDYKNYVLRRVFRFTESGAFPENDDLKEWSGPHEIVKARARRQLDLFEKNGPVISNLKLSHYSTIRAFFPKAGKIVTLTKQQREALKKDLLANLQLNKLKKQDVKPVCVFDLFCPELGGWMLGQCWVHEDGTFGFSWLPEHSWGKSENLPMLLQTFESSQEKAK